MKWYAINKRSCRYLTGNCFFERTERNLSNAQYSFVRGNVNGKTGFVSQKRKWQPKSVIVFRLFYVH